MCNSLIFEFHWRRYDAFWKDAARSLLGGELCMTVLPSKQTSGKPPKATSEAGASQVALVFVACTFSSLDQQWISILGASCLVEQTIDTGSQEKRKLTKFTNPQSKELSRRLTKWLKFTSKHFRVRPGQKAHFYENWTHCQLNMAPTQLRGKTGFHCTAGSELAWNRTVLTNQDHWDFLCVEIPVVKYGAQ